MTGICRLAKTWSSEIQTLRRRLCLNRVMIHCFRLAYVAVEAYLRFSRFGHEDLSCIDHKNVDPVLIRLLNTWHAIWQAINLLIVAITRMQVDVYLCAILFIRNRSCSYWGLPIEYSRQVYIPKAREQKIALQSCVLEFETPLRLKTSSFKPQSRM